MLFFSFPQSDKFAADVHVVEQPLLALIAVQAAQEQKNFYDELHLSPLKVNIFYYEIKVIL